MRIVTAIAFCLSALSLKSQDIHFSQFYMAPTQMNPALTGFFNGTIRAGINYRDQWKSANAGYTTSAFSFDAGFFKKKWKSFHLGAGLFVITDKAGDLDWRTNAIHASLSGVFLIDQQNKLAIGFQGGGVQNSIQPQNARWDNQFNGQVYDPNLPSYQNITSNTINYADFSTGISWNFGTETATVSSREGFHINTGIAYHHLSQPDKTVLNQPHKLYSKVILHVETRHLVKNTNFSIIPSMQYITQGPSYELNTGTYIRFVVKDESKYTGFFKEAALSVGTFYRHKDAIIPAVLLEYANYAIGITYDTNVSSLKTATEMRGGLEIALRYINPSPFRKQSAPKSKSTRFL